MIKNFKSSTAQDIYDGISSTHSKKIPSMLHDKISRLFDQLNAVTKIDSLRVPPSNHLKKLIGNKKNFWSIRVNDQYRVIFKWDNGEAIDVDVQDYH